MKCNNCNKKATVHLTEIIDGHMTELHLCEECAKEKSVHMEQQFGLADLLAGLGDFGKTQEVKSKDQHCGACGLTYEEFRKLGRLGCSECYSFFRKSLTPLLKKIHGANYHLGKRPRNFVDVPPEVSVSEEPQEMDLATLKSELMRAVEIENFERAAELRDKIRELEG